MSDLALVPLLVLYRACLAQHLADLRPVVVSLFVMRGPPLVWLVNFVKWFSDFLLHNKDHPAGTTSAFAQSDSQPGFALFSHPVLAVFPRLLEAPFLLFSLKTVWANSLKVQLHAQSVCQLSFLCQLSLLCQSIYGSLCLSYPSTWLCHPVLPTTGVEEEPEAGCCLCAWLVCHRITTEGSLSLVTAPLIRTGVAATAPQPARRPSGCQRPPCLARLHRAVQYSNPSLLSPPSLSRFLTSPSTACGTFSSLACL